MQKIKMLPFYLCGQWICVTRASPQKCENLPRKSKMAAIVTRNPRLLRGLSAFVWQCSLPSITMGLSKKQLRWKGHSEWQNRKYKKAHIDFARSKEFGKLSLEIITAVRGEMKFLAVNNSEKYSHFGWCSITEEGCYIHILPAVCGSQRFRADLLPLITTLNELELHILINA